MCLFWLHFPALISNSHGRRQSIDLLDGLDLDFLNVKKGFGGSFDGDLFFDELDGGTTEPEDPFKLPLSLGEDSARGNTGLQATTIPARARSTSGQQFAVNGEVDMSEYDAIAASLQNLQHPHGVCMYVCM